MIYIAKLSNSRYEFHNTVTGQYKTWRIPPNLPINQHQSAIDKAVELFSTETDAKPHNHLICTAPISLMNKKCSPDTTLYEYCESVFLPRKAISIKEHTRAAWVTLLNIRIYPRLGNLPIGSITPTIIMDFLLGCQIEGLAIGSVHQYYMILACIFDMAFNTDIIFCNPMLKVKRPKPRDDEMIQSGVEAFTASEIVEIENHLQRKPLKWQVLVEVLINTGMRVGEVCGLMWKDIDWAQHSIKIQRSVCYTKQKGIYISTPKNRRFRSVPISHDLVIKLEQFYNTAPESSGYIFTYRDANVPLHPSSPGHWMAKFGKEYGINHLHPHKLRHSFASIALTNGADLASISEILGHQDKSTTLRIYTRANEESCRKASEIYRRAVDNAIPT